jgi:hypothetical protein
VVEIVRSELAEYEVAVRAKTRCVAIDRGLEKLFKKVTPKDQGKIRRWMEIWCRDGAANIPKENLKPQERFQDVKGRSVQIWAFKSYQARMYGFSRIVDGRETFFVTAIDPAKKNDDADPAMLKKSKNEAFRILDVLGLR